MTYATLPLDLAAHRDALARLWAENMNDPAVAGVVHERVRWLYEQNPEGPPTTLVIDDVGRDGIVGCASVVPRRVRLGGREVRAGILSDLAVSKRHRIGGPALMAQRALIEAARREGYAFLWGYPNKNALPVAKRVGYQFVGESTSWVRPLRTAPLLRRFGPPPAADVGGALLDAALALVEGGAALALAPGRAGAHEVQIDARFDELWARAAGAYDLTGARGAAYLRWRYEQFPSARHYTFGLTSRRSGALAGYVAYRGVSGGRAHVMDLFCEDPARELDALLLRFVQAARAAGYASIAIDLIAGDDVYARLKRLGFVRRPDARSFVVQPLSLDGEGAAAVADARRWYIVDGDLDI
ncbi:MAG TPA: GNAT family N-acetyltransferase [Polyangiaceae bacterium]|nr:GNAT family N-acetyltransferase [Polyangiaceae bacterium]